MCALKSAIRAMLERRSLVYFVPVRKTRRRSPCSRGMVPIITLLLPTAMPR
jgi:hypothetical protein